MQNISIKNIKNNNINILNINKIRYDLIYQTIIWQLSYKRNIISHVKEKSKVKKSTRKIYKQKGTGRARHGSLKANQFRGGGVVFGPNKNKKYFYKINKKIKKTALLNSIALKHKENCLLIYNKLNLKYPQLNFFYKIYGSFFKLKNKTLFIDNEIDFFFKRAIKNNFKLNTVQLKGINILDIISNKIICFSKKSFIRILSKFI